jgi:hypothetical protein
MNNLSTFFTRYRNIFANEQQKYCIKISCWLIKFPKSYILIYLFIYFLFIVFLLLEMSFMTYEAIPFICMF